MGVTWHLLEEPEKRAACISLASSTKEAGPLETLAFGQSMTERQLVCPSGSAGIFSLCPVL